MAKYESGDIVLLNGAALGIVTSSNQVKAIKGNDIICNVNDGRIVKKLTAKELAETVVDLMARYQTLKNSSPKQSTSDNNNNNNPSLSLPQKNRHLYKKSTTDTTNTTTTATTTTASGTNTNTKSGTKSIKTGITTTTTTTATSSSSEPKPATINTETEIKTDFEIPKTPNDAHTFSPTSKSINSDYTNIITYHHFPAQSHGNYTNHAYSTNMTQRPVSTKLIVHNNNRSMDESQRTATSTISSLSPELAPKKPKKKSRRSLLPSPKMRKNKKNQEKYSNAPKLVQSARHETKRKLRMRSPFGKSKKNKSKPRKMLKEQSIPSESHTPQYNAPPPRSNIEYNQSYESIPTESQSHPQQHPLPPYKHPHHRSTPYIPQQYYGNDPYNYHHVNYQEYPYQSMSVQPPTTYHYGQIYSRDIHHGDNHHHMVGLNRNNTHYMDYDAVIHNKPNPLYFSTVKSDPQDQYKPAHDNNTLLPPEHEQRGHGRRYGGAPKNRISRSKSTEVPPRYTPSNQPSHPIQRQNINMNTSTTHITDKSLQKLLHPNQHHPHISFTPSNKTGHSSNIPPIPSPNAHYHQSHHNQPVSEYNFNPNHPRFHPHNLSVVSPSENSTTAPIPAHIGHIEHTAPPQHQYNHQSHQFPPHSFSNPNPIPPEQLAQQLSLSPRRHEDVTLLDTLLSAPDDHHDDNQQINNIKQKKSKSHQPRMYKRRELETTKQKKSKSKPHKHESVAKLVSSHTEMTSPSESNHDTQSHKYHPLKLVKTPEPQSIIDPILQSGSGQPRYINHLSNHSRIRGDSINNSSKELRAVSYEHQKNTSNTTESRITINSDPRGDVYVNYRDENSYTNNGNYDNLRDKDTKSININDHYRHNDSIQFDSVSPRNSRRNSPKHCLSQSGPQTHQIGNYRGNSHSPGRGNNNRSYQSPRDRNRKNGRPFSAKYTKFDFERIVPNKYGHRGQRNLKQPRREHQHQHSTTKSKSGTYSEVEGKEFSSQNRTIRPFYPSKNNGNGAMEKPKLGKHNAYSSPLYNINGSEYLIHPKHMNQGYKNVSPRKNANNYHSQAKTMDNLMSNVSNVDLEEILSINNHAYDMDDDNMHYVQSIEKSATDTVIVHNNNKENINNNNNMHNMESQNEIHEGSPFHHGKSPSFSILDRNQGTFGGINHVTSMDDMDPLILSPINKRRTHLKKQRSQSVVELFSNEPSHLGDIHDINHTPIQIKQSASDDLDVTSDDMNDIVHDPDYKNINKRNKTKKQRRKSIDHNNQTPNETPTYKIVLKTEDSNYLEYKTPKSKDNNNNLNKPRFSQSASTATTTTATISQTPSYLREDRKWDVSMKYQSQTGTHSVESDNSGSSSTGEWMLHGMINVNGNVEEPQERGFFNDENGEFPNIESVPNRSKTHLNNTNKKPQVSPRLSPHDIASKHELQQRIILKKSKHHRKHHQNHNLLTSPTATTATSVTDTVTNESDDAFIYNQ